MSSINSIPWMPERAWTTARSKCAIAGLTRSGFTPDHVQINPPCQGDYVCEEYPEAAIWNVAASTPAHERTGVCLDVIDQGSTFPGGEPVWYRVFKEGDDPDTAIPVSEGATMAEACWSPEDCVYVPGTPQVGRYFVRALWDSVPYEGGRCYVFPDSPVFEVSWTCCEDVVPVWTWTAEPQYVHSSPICVSDLGSFDVAPAYVRLWRSDSSTIPQRTALLGEGSDPSTVCWTPTPAEEGRNNLWVEYWTDGDPNAGALCFYETTVQGVDIVSCAALPAIACVAGPITIESRPEGGIGPTYFPIRWTEFNDGSGTDVGSYYEIHVFQNPTDTVPYRSVGSSDPLSLELPMYCAEFDIQAQWTVELRMWAVGVSHIEFPVCYSACQTSVELTPIGGDCGTSAVPTGRRTIQISQNGIFTNGLAAEHGGQQNTWFIVDACLWLWGGNPCRVWVSLNETDYSFYGWGNERSVGADARAALTGAGFTLTEGPATEEFDFADDLYDILIVGGLNVGQGSGPDFASGLTDEQRGAMIANWVNAGGGAIVLRSNVSWTNSYQVAFGFSGSGSFYHNHLGNYGMTGARAGNPTLFREGLTFGSERHHSVRVAAVDANHANYYLDGDIAPYEIMAVYSAHGDA